MSLIARAGLGLAGLLAVLGAILFVLGGFHWQGFAYLTVFGTASGLITICLSRRDPALLERRVHAGPLAEPTSTQRTIQSLAGVAFCAIFVVSALTRMAAVWVSTIGLALVACGFWIVFRVFRVNTFTAGTVEVARGQSVVDTGPYAIVRHPMYSGALLLLVGTPLALGSWWGLATVPIIGAAVIARLLDEERQLARALTGYDAYCERVRWRIAPGVY